MLPTRSPPLSTGRSAHDFSSSVSSSLGMVRSWGLFVLREKKNPFWKYQTSLCRDKPRAGLEARRSAGCSGRPSAALTQLQPHHETLVHQKMGISKSQQLYSEGEVRPRCWGWGFCRARPPPHSPPPYLASLLQPLGPGAGPLSVGPGPPARPLSSAPGTGYKMGLVLPLKCGCEDCVRRWPLLLKGQPRTFQNLPRSHNNKKQTAQVGHCSETSPLPIN